jgi:hypothetical protein
MRSMYLACRLALPLGALVLIGIEGAGAQVVDARQACTPDAMRLCSEFIPDVPKITACMHAKRAQLSAECRLAMNGGGHKTHQRHRRHHS